MGKGLRERFGAEDAHAVAFEHRHVGHRRFGRRDDPGRHFPRRLDERNAEVQHCAAIEHDPHRRLARRESAAGGELRVVGQRRRAADGDGVESRPQPMDVIARFGTRDPLRAAAGIGDPAVDGRCELQRDERPVRLLPREEKRGVLRGRLLREQPDLRFDAGALQNLDAAARLEIRVAHRRDHAPHAGRADRIRAGRRLALMRAGLEGDDERRPAGLFARGMQGVQLRMRAAEFGVPAFGDRLVAPQHHGADERIGGHATPPAPRQLERSTHGRQLPFVIFLQTAPQACCPRGPLR